MTYLEALDFISRQGRFAMKLGTERTRAMLDLIGAPDRSMRGALIAGTNGKGSVCAMIDSILRAQNYRTGLFTSPHLITFRERIRVNGEMISEDAVANGLTTIRDLVRDWDPHPTFFEIATATVKLCLLVSLQIELRPNLS